MQTKWDVVGEAAEILLHSFLYLALGGGQWSASRSGCFTPRERTLIMNWTGGWVGLTACLLSYWESKHGPSNP